MKQTVSELASQLFVLLLVEILLLCTSLGVLSLQGRMNAEWMDEADCV